MSLNAISPVLPSSPQREELVLAKDQPEYRPLPFVDAPIPGVMSMIETWTCYQFTPEQISALLANGGRLWVSQWRKYGTPYSPMRLTVGEPYTDADKGDDVESEILKPGFKLTPDVIRDIVGQLGLLTPVENAHDVAQGILTRMHDRQARDVEAAVLGNTREDLDMFKPAPRPGAIAPAPIGHYGWWPTDEDAARRKIRVFRGKGWQYDEAKDQLAFVGATVPPPSIMASFSIFLHAQKVFTPEIAPKLDEMLEPHYKALQAAHEIRETAPPTPEDDYPGINERAAMLAAVHSWTHMNDEQRGHLEQDLRAAGDMKELNEAWERCLFARYMLCPVGPMESSRMRFSVCCYCGDFTFLNHEKGGRVHNDTELPECSPHTGISHITFATTLADYERKTKTSVRLPGEMNFPELPMG